MSIVLVYLRGKLIMICQKDRTVETESTALKIRIPVIVAPNGHLTYHVRILYC